MKRFVFGVVALMLLNACGDHHKHEKEDETHPVHQDGGHSHANQHMNSSSFENLVARFEDPARDSWQKPQRVLELLGNLEGKTVMDIGSGTGYFSFPMAKAGATVICADVDERFLDYIKTRQIREEVHPDRLILRKVPYDSPALAEGEVDLVLNVDTYHHIENRPAYFSQVRKGLREGGRLVVIDFNKTELPVGPPVEMKLTPEAVVAELKEAGFSDFEINREDLPYQYLVFAR